MFSYTKLMQAMVAAGVVTPTDPYFNLVTLLLPGNGTNGAQNNTFLDSSSNNFSITRNGNTTQGTFSPFSQTGWSNYFPNSSNESVGVTSTNAAFALGTGDFTIECWVCPTKPDYAQGFFHINTSVNSTVNGYGVGITSAGLVQYYGGATFTNTNVTVTSGQWYHIALVRSSGTLKIYINGTNPSSGGSVSDSQNLGNSLCYVGLFYATTGTCMTGYVSNFRVTKSGALYTSNFTPSTTPLTTTVSSGTVSFLTCQSNRFVDNSASPLTLTIAGAPSVQAFSPFAPTAAYSAATVGGSGYFDGTGDSLVAASNAAFAIGAGDYSIETWIYFVGTAAGGGLSGELFGSTTSGSMVLRYLSGTLALSRVGTADDMSASVTLTVGQWYHVCATRTGTTGALYLNGSRVATASSYTASYAQGDMQCISGTNGYYSGSRLIKGSNPYGTGTTLTLPTTPVTAITNTSLLLNFTNAGITDATAKNIFETVGNSSISTAQSKFGGGSMFFDGTGDYLTLGNATVRGSSIQVNSIGTANATIEMWVYSSNSSSSLKCLIDTRSGQGTDTGYGIYQIANNVVIYGNGVKGNAAGQLAGNTWTHLAVTRANTTNYVFIGGTLYNTFTYGSTLTSSNVTIASDVAGSNAFTGYIDDLRITNGYARYTANFTPTTVTFPLQ